MSDHTQPLPQRPLLLTLGMAWSLLVGVGVGLAGVVKIIGTVWRSPRAGLAEGLHEGMYLGLLVCAALAVIGWGLWVGKSWTRLAMMGCWLASFLMAVTELVLGKVEGAAGYSSILSILLSAGLAALYLYRKESVRNYYAALGPRPKPTNGAA